MKFGKTPKSINQLKMAANTTETSSLDTSQLILTTFCFIFDFVGIISNVALIHIFKQKDLKVRFNCLMILLTAFDLAKLFSFDVNALLYFLEVDAKALRFLDHLVFNCSTYTMMAMALERFRWICRQK